MTTNKDLRRRETDKLGEWIQQAALDDANKRIAELEAESNHLQVYIFDFVVMMNGFGLDLIRCGVGGNYSGNPYENSKYLAAANIVKSAEILIEEIESKNEPKPF
jgi:hypothetical protein